MAAFCGGGHERESDKKEKERTDCPHSRVEGERVPEPLGLGVDARFVRLIFVEHRRGPFGRRELVR